MKKITLKYLLVSFLCLPLTVLSQSKVPVSKGNTSNFINSKAGNQQVSTQSVDTPVRCATVENEASLQARFPERASTDEFENWLAPKITATKASLSQRSVTVVQTVPIIFHIITDGAGSDNVSQALINAQISQLNIDFGNLAGSTYGVAADTELQFCAAVVDPNGNDLAEPGINRITDYGDDQRFDTYIESTIKPNTQWDPTKYMNVWILSDIQNASVGSLLGYAQFPSSSGLSGLTANGGNANTDGIAVIASSVGSTANPNPAGGVYARGRTLTHEAGHFFGLRHIWGDGDCGVDDYCDDTPNASGSTSGCPSGKDTCTTAGVDMIENYMDYSNDTCLNTFTADQKARILAVMSNSPRRMELANSDACNAAPTVKFGSTSPETIIEQSECNYQDLTIDLSLSSASTAAVTATVSVTGTAAVGKDFDLIGNTVTFASGSTTPSNSLTLRVYNDSFIEANETISLSIAVSTTGDAEATTNTYDLSITNDDIILGLVFGGSSITTDVFFEDFEDVTGWSVLDADNDGFTWGIYDASAELAINTANHDYEGAIAAAFSFDAFSQAGTPLTPDDYLISPAVTIPTTASTVDFSYIVGSYDTDDFYAEHYSIYFTTDISTVATIQAGTVLENDREIPANGTELRTHSVSNLAGQTGYFIIRHHNVTDEFMLGFDTLTITSNQAIAVQTEVNTSASDNVQINDSGTLFALDPTTGNAMIELNNTGGYDYGCTEVAVSRSVTSAGAAAVQMNSANTSDYVTAKTFDITATNSGTGAASINFCFTDEELTAWETATGNNRTDIYVKNVTTGEIAETTIGSFLSDVKLQSSLTQGITGTYYFGTQSTLLSVNSFELENTISLYPNPTSNQLTIKLGDANDLPDTYEIYNMLGQIISKRSISNSADLTINASALSNGMYFIRISKENSATTLQFIKR